MDQLDKTDLRLLEILQQEARLTTKELAARVHLSTTPVYERIRRLERDGYIRGYGARLDAERLGQGFVVFCNVKLAQINSAVAREFAAAVAEMEEVRACYNISGDYDYMLRISVRDMRAYQHFLVERLGALAGVCSMQSVFVMDTLKEDAGISLTERR